MVDNFLEKTGFIFKSGMVPIAFSHFVSSLCVMPFFQNSTEEHRDWSFRGMCYYCGLKK